MKKTQNNEIPIIKRIESIKLKNEKIKEGNERKFSFGIFSIKTVVIFPTNNTIAPAATPIIIFSVYLATSILLYFFIFLIFLKK